jgi:hypothetical protein
MYQMKPNMLIFGGSITVFGANGINDRFRASWSVQKSLQLIYTWYLVSFDIYNVPLAFFHVEFEDELSISLLRNKATLYKNLPLEIVKFLKKSNACNGRLPTFIFQPPLLLNSWALQSVKTGRKSKFPRVLEHVLKN